MWRRLESAAALAALFFFLVAPLRAGELSPQVIANTKAAVVYIVVRQSAGGGAEMVGSGSGFFVDDRTIATNWHVVSPKRVLAIRDGEPVIGDTRVEEIQVIVNSGGEQAQRLPCRVVLHSAEDDLALLQVETSPRVQPLGLADAGEVAETTGLWVFGFPFGEMLAMGSRGPEISVNRCSVSSLRRDDEGQLKLIQVDGAVNPGNSGGPALDANGRVAGIVVAGVQGAAINFLIPVQTLTMLLEGRLSDLRCEPANVDLAGGRVRISCRCSALRGPPNGVQGRLDLGNNLQKQFTLRRTNVEGLWGAEVAIPAAPGGQPRLIGVRLSGSNHRGRPLNALAGQFGQGRAPPRAENPLGQQDDEPGEVIIIGLEPGEEDPGPGRPEPSPGTARPTPGPIARPVTPAASPRPPSPSAPATPKPEFAVAIEGAGFRAETLHEGITAFSDGGGALAGVPVGLTSRGAQIVRAARAGAQRPAGPCTIRCPAPFNLYLLSPPGTELAGLTEAAGWRALPALGITVGGESWTARGCPVTRGEIALPPFPADSGYLAIVGHLDRKAWKRYSGEGEALEPGEGEEETSTPPPTKKRRGRKKGETGGE